MFRRPPHGDGWLDPRTGQMSTLPLGQGDVGAESDIALEAEAAPAIGALYDRITARNVPAQVNYVPRFATITKRLDPQILVPKNPRRISLIISNAYPPALYDATGVIVKGSATGVVFSYDFPQRLNVAAGPLWSADFQGVPLAPQSEWIENNGAVSTNDIWVVCNDLNAVFPFNIVAFEGQLAIAGNRKK